MPGQAYDRNPHARTPRAAVGYEVNQKKQGQVQRRSLHMPKLSLRIIVDSFRLQSFESDQQAYGTIRSC